MHTYKLHNYIRASTRHICTCTHTHTHTLCIEIYKCLLLTKIINPQQLAYLANSTMIIPIMPFLLVLFNMTLHKTHVMALLSKSIAGTSKMSKT